MRITRISISLTLSVVALALSGCGSDGDAPAEGTTSSPAGDSTNACVQLAADNSRLCGDDAKDVCARNLEEGNSLLIAGYIDDSLTSEDQACVAIDPSLEAAIDAGPER